MQYKPLLDKYGSQIFCKFGIREVDTVLLKKEAIFNWRNNKIKPCY